MLLLILFSLTVSFQNAFTLLTFNFYFLLILLFSSLSLSTFRFGKLTFCSKALPGYRIYLNFGSLFYWGTLLTKIFTVLVRARTRTVSKEVIRFSWLGRVVKKKLERARQQKLEMAKESRQRRTSPIIGSFCF